MKLKLTALTVGLVLSTNISAYGLQIPENDASWYYALGGERAVTAPPSYQTNSIVLGGSANWGTGFNCSSFDPTLGIANTLNDVKSGADAVQQQVVEAATGAIASLPLLMLQRANPGLYELLMNSMASAKERVSVATKTCQQVQQNISDGVSPYEDWIVLSRSQDWKGQMGDGGYRSSNVDAVQAQENVDKANGENGIYWLAGSKAGGRGQPPISIPSDIAKAGYNSTFNRDPRSESPAPSNGSRLGSLWESPEEMLKWSKSILGEERIRTYRNHETETLPGRGLTFQINEEAKELQPKFNQLVSGQLEMKGTNLLEVSAPNIVVTRGTIESIRSLTPIESKILSERLVQEVATSRVIEKALMLRRLMVAGLQEPNVHASGLAYDQTKRHLDVLSQSIETVMYEVEMNKRLASSTSRTIQNLNAAKKRDGLSTPNGPSEQPIVNTDDALMMGNN